MIGGGPISSSRPDIDWRGLYDRGWSVFPLKSRSKVPAIPWKRFQSERATLDEIGKWAEADYNVGIVTGTISGIVVLDCDTREAIAEAENLGLEGAQTVRTSKGAHFYFSYPSFEVRNRAGFNLGMDLRGDGGFVVGPGSIHPDGAIYSELGFWL